MTSQNFIEECGPVHIPDTERSVANQTSAHVAAARPVVEDRAPQLKDTSLAAYDRLLRAKAPVAQARGYDGPLNLSTDLKPHARDIAEWMIRGGNRACFASYGLNKTSIQLQVLNSLLDAYLGGGIPCEDPFSVSALIVCPLGVRREFILESERRRFNRKPVYIRTNEEHAARLAEGHQLFLTNYDRVRDGQIDPKRFQIATLDEASVLRGYGTKTFQEFLPLFAGVPFKFVATATPSPNRLKELIHYAGFLGIMDTGQALTRFFKRDSKLAGNLTLHPHKEREFWLWVQTWAVFLLKPSDLNPAYSDDGYILPEIEYILHRIPADHATAGEDSWGQAKMFRDASAGLKAAAKEKRDSLDPRVEECRKIIEADKCYQCKGKGKLKGKTCAACDGMGGVRHIIWHDLENERKALEKAILGIQTITGDQSVNTLDEREAIVEAFADGKVKDFGTKATLSGSGANLQICWSAIWLGVNYKANDFMQGNHRIQRFGQQFIGWNRPGETPHVVVHLIFTEAEDPVYFTLMEKIRNHEKLHGTMAALTREYGLNSIKIGAEMERAIDDGREEVVSREYLACPACSGRLASMDFGTCAVCRSSRGVPLWTAVNSDNVREVHRLPDNSVDLVVTSWPFSDHYEYTECYDEQTEVLTWHGWKSFGSVTTEDFLATVNKETLKIEMQSPDRVFWEHYSGPMLHFHTRNSFDMLVTPNHSMFTSRRVGNSEYRKFPKKWELTLASEMKDKFEPRKYALMAAPVPGDGVRLETILIPKTRKRTMPNTRNISRSNAGDIMELAGWYLSEGCCVTSGSSAGAIHIAQSRSVNLENHNLIMALIRRLGLPARSSDKAVVTHNVDLANWLVLQFGAGSYSKRIPRWVMGLHPSLLCRMRDSMMRGDGNDNGYAYASVSRELRDGFQELALRTGWRTSIAGDIVRIGQTNIHPEVRKEPEVVEYNGMIGCATVPNHTLIVRRNGTAMVSGNSYNDFGHNDGDKGFFEQMEFLTPQIMRTLKPGRMYCVHAKDRIVYGAVSGLGMYSVNRFSDKCADHLERHGFIFCGRITVTTDVVRENNQTYRLGYSENAKDGTKMGVGSPEYILLFRKLPTDRANSYADEPVVKNKPLVENPLCLCGHGKSDHDKLGCVGGDGTCMCREFHHATDAGGDLLFASPVPFHDGGRIIPGTGYSRANWQFDAHSYWRTSGNRFMRPEEIAEMPMDALRAAWLRYSRAKVYDFGEHVNIAEEMEKRGILPASFMCLDVANPGAANVWDDITRMRTLNSEQARKKVEQHVCPLQIEIVERLIRRFSNKGDLVLDPFAGLHTVPYVAVHMGRRGYGIELNEQYWRDGVSYCRSAEQQVTAPTLFDFLDTDEAPSSCGSSGIDR